MSTRAESPRIALLEQLREELSRGRHLLRQERQQLESQYQEDLGALAIARQEAEDREYQASQERRRLVRLRQKFLARWKRHWELKRIETRQVQDTLTNEQISLQLEQQRLQEQKAQLENFSVSEKARIQKGWEDLSAEEQDWRLRWKLTETDLISRKAELEKYAYYLVELEQAWLKRKEEIQSQCLSKARELVSLDRRILALRNSVPAQPAALEYRTESTEARLSDSNSDPVPEKLVQLYRARESWRSEQIALLVDLEELGTQLQNREQELDQRERSIAQREASILETETELERRQAELEGREADFNNREKARHREKELLEDEIRLLHKNRKQIQLGLTKLVDVWTERQSTLLVQVRNEQGRCKAMLEDWTRKLEQVEQEQRQVRETALAQARQQVVLEQLRTKLVEESENPLVSKYRIERYERRLDRALRKATARLDGRHQEVLSMLQELREAEAGMEERYHYLLADAEKALTELAERELHRQEEGSQLEQLENDLEHHRNLCQQQEKTIQHLHQEIERISRLMYLNDNRRQNRAA
ncbi:hypothetical protein KIH39_00800 [Telmatocola sphagniphila]|uniref:Uncharacterized protein n=1 Tax=Telmatocola sphagniphila TaxID=1123043 RepID=A0A8E6B5X6_9BACT|nr:hypothetical protein [Telmatocola sphagniphila]QVL32487.1 hypothetical protein KIH39_00800 [Telmatocola sphagniphila]